MTLVELIIVVVITSCILIAVGFQLTTTLGFSNAEFGRIAIENDALLFQNQFSKEFRNATNDPANIVTTSLPDDTFRFASCDNYDLTNQYTQHEYKLENNMIRHNYWTAAYSSSGVLMPDSPWGSTPDGTEVVAGNSASVQNLTFRWSGVALASASVSVNAVQAGFPQTLTANYVSTCTFIVTNLNRLRGVLGYETTK